MGTEVKGLEFEIRGGQFDGRKLGISRVPGRKSPVLYVEDGLTIKPLAYFRSAEAANEAGSFLKEMCLMMGVDETG